MLVATVALAFASFQQSERPASAAFHIPRSLFTDTQRDDKMLQFKPDGTFKIVQFTDLHMGENDTSGVYDAAQDMRTMEVRGVSCSMLVAAAACGCHLGEYSKPARGTSVRG